MAQAKMRHCWFCGCEMGIYADYDRMDTCGKQDCERAARDEYRGQAEEAAERAYDDEMGGW